MSYTTYNLIERISMRSQGDGSSVFSAFARRQMNRPLGFCDALAPEYDIIQAMIDARKSQNLTQKELSDRTGITQADISRIEKGTRNPSLEMLKRLALGLGMQLKVEFIKPSKS